MGGGRDTGTTLTPDEKKGLSIIGKTASEGISGGIDLLGNEGLSENTEGEEEEEPSGSRAATYTSPGEDDPPQLSPVPARQPAGPGVRMRGGLIGRPPITPAPAARCWCVSRVETGGAVGDRGPTGETDCPPGGDGADPTPEVGAAPPG